VTNDDELQTFSGEARAVALKPRSAFFLETADEKSGDFDDHIAYSVIVPLPDGTRVTGTFAIRRYLQRSFDTYEDDPILGVQARIIGPQEWWPIRSSLRPA